MPSWLKRSLLNLWRKPFRTGLVAAFLALVVGLFTVMATVNRLAAERFAELEGALETIIDIRPIGSLALGGAGSRPLPFALEDEVRGMEPNPRVSPYLIHRVFAGEQQRVAIARALINRPALVLADEPTGNLDTETGAAIVEVLTSLAGEQTVIIATHDERIAGAAGRIIHLSDGRIGKDQVVSRQADTVAP
ncbi:MAG: ATP-binding cassette domain-containing protein [Proteobacteria bacterium]|nr:ATP-binding cassette domain-containing protein [Pseudomonadota bacterium]